MSDTEKTPKANGEEADRRLRETIDKLLAQAPATREDHITLGGRSLTYDTIAAFVPITTGGIDNKRGEVEAAVFTTAYIARDAGRRPLCFAFNGGPGAASVFLNLGALGPKRVVINDDGTMPAPPYQVADNPLSWLEHFDLVFVDPPHTGFSLSASADARKRHLSVDGDIAALAECVRTWLARHKRWSSPVYIAGESYGTTRGAGIADKLHEIGVALSGVILVSCAMDFQALDFRAHNETAFATFLPAFAATAQYHGKLSGALGASPAAARAAAEAFVSEDYLAALFAGARLPDKRRRTIAKRVAELTGLSLALVEEKNQRISDETFFFELLRDRGLIVGRLESRVTGPMAASRTRTWEFDPGMEALWGPYTMAANAYYGETLGLVSESRYDVFSADAHEAWDFNRGKDRGMGYCSTSADLARALRRNPHLKVFVASGHYDLGTPYSATDWSLAQLDAPADVLARVAHHYYDAGHMMYTREADLKKLKADLSAWLTEG